MENKAIKLKYIGIGSLGVFLLVCLDQWAKNLAEKFLGDGKTISLIDGVLKLQYLENRGAAFGIMENEIWLFAGMTVLFIIAAVFAYINLPKTKHLLLLHIIIGVLLSGALGNFIDRVRLGYVVDFIYFSLIDFPIFNVADIYVTLAAFALLFSVFFFYKDDDFTFLPKSKKEGEKQ